MTDRPDPASMASVVTHQDSLATTAASTLPQVSSAATEDSILSQMSSPASSSAHAQLLTQVFSPSTVRPFHKAGPRKSTGTTRRSRKSDIYTDIPVKQAWRKKKRRMGKCPYLERGNANKIMQRGRQKKRDPERTRIRMRTPQRKMIFALCAWSPLEIPNPKKSGSDV